MGCKLEADALREFEGCGHRYEFKIVITRVHVTIVFTVEGG